jgi:hypothetical protein
LSLISEQDSSTFDRKDKQGGFDVAFGSGGGWASGYYGQQRVESDYHSVNEQTGIQAGAGGFDIIVGGHTDLVGVAIASTANPDRNFLSTGSLSVSDLENEVEYSAGGWSISGGIGSGGGTFNPLPTPTQSDADDSKTRAGISQGTVDIRNGDDSALASLDRDVTQLQQNGLKEIFDEQKVQESEEFAAGLGATAIQIVDDIYKSKLAGKQAEIDAVMAAADDATARSDLALADQLYEQVTYMRMERDKGHGMAITKSIVGVAVVALVGDISLQSGATYAGANAGISFWDEAAERAMLAHDETMAIKITCTKTAQECADIRMPENLKTTEERIQYLREQGMTIEFVDQIPDGVTNIAVNGIINDAARAGHVEVGHVSMRTGNKMDTEYYVQYNATQGFMSDLIQAGYDKFISPINGDYSATTVALVDAIFRQGDASEVNMYAHSWGTIVTRNVLNILSDSEYKNENFTVSAYGAAVRPGALVDAMVEIVGYDNVFPKDKKERNLIYLTSPSDPVSTFVGWTMLPSKYFDENNSEQGLPGAARGRVWSALKGFGAVFDGPVNPHSCYGLNCAGSSYNWTENSTGGVDK